MKIGLIDVDGHNFPNLALMRISAYHKAQGDSVEWVFPFDHYDIVYQSKIFSNAYTPDIEYEPKADLIIKGGTGYAISIVDGVEVYDKEKDPPLPVKIERMAPDYSIYPQFDFAVAMTSRGCPRGCGFCIVGKKEGRCSVKVADVGDFWKGQKQIEVLDPNILACKDKRELFRQYKETGARINFNQGLDIRLINEDDIADLNEMRVANMHFAWDNPKDDLLGKFEFFRDKYKRKHCGTVYCLTNYNSTIAEDLYRINNLAKLGFDPYVMLYNKPDADREHRALQRWCNNKWIFKTTPNFNDYGGANHAEQV